MAVTPPSPEKLFRQRVYNAAYDEWSARQVPRTDVPFHPRGNDSDYNLHFVDIEADGAAEDDLQATVERHMRAAGLSTS